VSVLAAVPVDRLPSAGALTPLLLDPEITDILVNGSEVWIDRGAGLRRVPVDVGTPADVRRLAQRLATAAGRRLDDGSPFVDCQLADGSRVHAVLPPIAQPGPLLSVRTFRRRELSLGDLIHSGAVPAHGAALLAAIVRARLSYLVVGGAGSGKTTLLGVLLALIPGEERIVLVEDAAELRPPHPHLVALQGRPANVEGAGEVGLRDLIRQALRMRPDRLVVGECRGAEVVDLLGALNTGHQGSAATLHANTAADVPARLEALGLLGGVPPAALHAQISAGLQVTIQVRRSAAGRHVEQVCLLLPGTGRRVSAVTAWHRAHGTGPAAGALARLLREHGVPPPAALTRAQPVSPGAPVAGPVVRGGGC
jgi:pilus assembly protein CpaF